ncbi:MAG: hypothetical protein FWB78_12815, partial [Treponema sp.]|nr:hypothetical protein [Treponema sp.]
ESIDPGPKSIFSAAYFEYDEAYVNHLANKINVLYKKPLRIMGLWHRHPGSMDTFSATDNSTHERYSHINPFGVVSALVNIDPSFRLSVYNVFRSGGRLAVSGRKLPFVVGNAHIPRELMAYNPVELLGNRIDTITVRGREGQEKNRLLSSIVKRAFDSNPEVRPVPRYGNFLTDRAAVVSWEPPPVPVLDDDLERIIEAFEEDHGFFERQGIVCKMSRARDNVLWFYGENEPGKKTCAVQIFIRYGDIYVRHGDRTISYRPGLFSEAGGRSLNSITQGVRAWWDSLSRAETGSI